MSKITLPLAALLLLLPGPLAAQTQFYPAEHQSQQEQDADAWQCHQWATETTGVDPIAMAHQESQILAEKEDEESLAGGAARGAEHGLLAGEVFGGGLARHAALGGGIGALRALHQHRKEMDRQHQAYLQAYRARQAKLKSYDHAVAACMKGRGYTTP
ncbi:MAG: hypothetical protein AAF495_04690 [Pseudomonadota bacterium]